MTNLSVHSRFRLRGIWVRPEVLGARYSWDLDGRRVHLGLPRSATDFNEPDHPEEAPVEAWVPTSGNGGPAGGIIVNLVNTEVQFDGPLCADAKTRALDARAAGEEATFDAFNREAQAACETGHIVAQQLVHAWLAHVRATVDQPWLGVRAEPPRQHGRCWLEDTEAGVRLVQLGPLQSATVRLDMPFLSLADLERVRSLVEGGHEPPPAESLLADARFLVKEAEVVDSQRAVLIAAMGCEIKAKVTMVERVVARDAAMLQLVLRRTSSLPRLVDEALRAAVGISLRNADPDLFRKIVKLTEWRNKIVHEGAEVGHADAWTLVAAAQQLFRWLDDLPARGSAGAQAESLSSGTDHPSKN